EALLELSASLACSCGCSCLIVSLPLCLPACADVRWPLPHFHRYEAQAHDDSRRRQVWSAGNRWSNTEWRRNRTGRQDPGPLPSIAIIEAAQSGGTVSRPPTRLGILRSVPICDVDCFHAEPDGIRKRNDCTVRMTT